MNVGEQVPAFELPGATETGRSQFTLTDYTDDGLVILSFYPFDFSPVCTTQLCDLRDVEWFQIEEDVDVFGISADSAYAHETFLQQHDLPFPLLSDYAKRVASEYGLLADELDGHEDVPKRAVMVIDDDRRLQYSWVRDDTFERPDTDALSTAVRDLL